MEEPMTPDTAAGMVAAAKQRIQNLSAEEVAAKLATGDVMLVDIREPEERAATGMIPGAVPAARGMLEFYADSTSPYHREGFETDRKIILYCASGGRSALATDMLKQLGYQNAAHLDGGIKAWIAAEQQVESA
jgi:rhodanese-related sulfurtransferase